MSEINLRPTCQIQMAHDVLAAVILEEVNISVDSEDRKSLHSALDVLCWILQHNHNTAFHENLTALMNELQQAGYVLERNRQ